MNEEPLTPSQAQNRRNYYQERVNQIEASLADGRYPELNRLLDDSWKDCVQTWLSSIQPGEPEPRRQLHHLIFALTDEDDSSGYLGIDLIEKRLRKVRQVSKAQGKTSQYKTTPNQLVVDNANQVHAALFEITVLSALIDIDPEIGLFPSVGSQGSNVEAKINLGRRDIYCECAIRGYSPILDDRQGAVDPYAVPEKMVKATLLKKVGYGGQLSSVANENPTILFTCVGFDGFHKTYIDVMLRRISQTPCSAVVIFERYHCKSFAIVLNTSSSHPLQPIEVDSITVGLKKQIGSNFRGKY